MIVSQLRDDGQAQAVLSCVRSGFTRLSSRPMIFRSRRPCAISTRTSPSAVQPSSCYSIISFQSKLSKRASTHSHHNQHSLLRPFLGNRQLPYESTHFPRMSTVTTVREAVRQFSRGASLLHPSQIDRIDEQAK